MRGHGSSTCRLALVAVAVLLPLFVASTRAHGQSTDGAPAIDNPLGVPDLRTVAPVATTREGISATLQILIVLTLLSLAPAILIMTTCFTRIVIVLALLRQAIGVQGLPPSQVVIGLSLFMTFVVMGPTWHRIHDDALRPWLDNQPGMTQARALEVATGHLREFMFNQIERAGNEESIYLFHEHARRQTLPAGETLRRSDVSTFSLIPAFTLSEIKTAFVMGFRIYLPFLVIDMVIASVLVSMGMLMLPPILISLPFKILLFVLADGWHLVIESLMCSFG